MGLAAATTLAVLVPTAAWAAPAGAPPPTVVAAALDGAITVITPCQGDPIVQQGKGLLKVERPNATSGDLAVDVSYGGTLQPGTDYDALPDPVVIAAGEDATILDVSASTAGTVTITIEPGEGYAVGSPATATTTITDTGGDFGCQDEVVETIDLGTKPTALPIYDTYGFGVGDSTLVMTGDVPPGLTYQQDGSWTGAATTLGTFRFTACYQIGGFCGLEIPFRITVVEVDASDPTVPAAPPAAAVPGRATFTG